MTGRYRNGLRSSSDYAGRVLGLELCVSCRDYSRDIGQSRNHHHLRRVASAQRPVDRMRPALGPGLALLDKAAISVAHFRPKQDVIDPAPGCIDIEIGGNDVVAAGQNNQSVAYRVFGVSFEHAKRGHDHRWLIFR